MPDLLLMACSARKCPAPREPIAAVDRYDGVFFRVLRKWARQTAGNRPDVLIVSARFGLIDAQTEIPDYDRRMTTKRAAELAPEIRLALKSRLEQNGYNRIFVNVGRDYLAALDGIDDLSRASWASGGIGQRAQQLKRWLEASC
ncbi:MAG: DUF6884 domain-containing protein [Terriglobales bacterium]